MTTERKAKWIAGVLTGLLALSITGSIAFYKSSNRYQTEAAVARLRQDSLLSIKKETDKEILQLKSELDAAAGKNAALDKLLADAGTQLGERQLLIDKLVKDNASVKALRRQLAELKALNQTMDKQIHDLLTLNEQLETENRQLKNRNTALLGEKEMLEEKLRNASAAGMRASNFRVEMQRKSGKK